MRSYKEYYQLALDRHNKWLYIQKEEWWKNEAYNNLITKGDYIETVNFLTIDEKNDSSLFHNHTNVKNSEWGILFDMLGQALVDWCVENVNYNDLWSYYISINRSVDGCSNFYKCSQKLTKCCEDEREYWIQTVEITDSETLEKFKECCDFLLGIVDTFITSHGKNIPNDWNRFSFGLDDLSPSCKYGQWVPTSDGYMNFGNFIDGEDGGYTNYVECM